MSGERVDPFAGLSKFKPKGELDESQPKADKADIEKISKDNDFPSREARAEKPQKRQRFNSTEPKKQLNIKVSETCHDRFYEMAQSRGIRVLGDLISEALDALEEKTRKS